MTEYEAYDTVMSIAAHTYTLMFGYFSLVFAFLTMSHLAAKKLSARLAAVVISLYTLASLVVVLNFYALTVDLDNLYRYMLEKKMSGVFDLAWFGMNPIWVPKALTFFQVMLGLGGYFGSVYFFYAARNRPAATA